MKAILTGMNGTVAPVVAHHLEAQGTAVTQWDRSQVSIEKRTDMQAFIERISPDWFFHIATGPPDWAEAVAEICAESNIKFLFTGSSSVFSDEAAGPFTIDTPPDAMDEYGRYKIECEQRVTAVNPQAIIARLGWQIGDGPGSNNMIDYLERTMQENGRIEASINWYPACSFLEDTAVALHQLMLNFPARLYHLDGNPGLSFYEIVTRLNKLHGSKWQVVAVELPTMNKRMVDDHIVVTPITETL